MESKIVRAQGRSESLSSGLAGKIYAIFTAPLFNSSMEILLGLAVVVGIIYYFVNASNTEERKKLWTAYHLAIKSGDKRAALIAGRAYYAKKRGGKPTSYDEQSIANDLSTME
jgi:hypothetical protein